MGTVCPKCGNYPVLLLRDRKEVYYACIPCGISAPSADSVDEARAAWETYADIGALCLFSLRELEMSADDSDDDSEMSYACSPCGITRPADDSAAGPKEPLADGSLPCEACGINGEDEE